MVLGLLSTSLKQFRTQPIILLREGVLLLFSLPPGMPGVCLWHVCLGGKTCIIKGLRGLWPMGCGKS